MTPCPSSPKLEVLLEVHFWLYNLLTGCQQPTYTQGFQFLTSTPQSWRKCSLKLYAWYQASAFQVLNAHRQRKERKPKYDKMILWNANGKTVIPLLREHPWCQAKNSHRRGVRSLVRRIGPNSKKNIQLPLHFADPYQGARKTGVNGSSLT